MGTRIGIGFSKNLQTLQAAQEASLEAISHLEGHKANLAIVFSTVHYDPSVTLPIINQHLPGVELVGSSTAGIILSENIESRGISILLIQSDEIHFATDFLKQASTFSVEELGAEFARDCMKNFKHNQSKNFLFFIDSAYNNLTPILKGMQKSLGNNFPIIGGGCSDDFSFSNNFQLHNTNAMKNSAVGIVMGGSLAIASAGGHGWRPLGKPRLADKVKGNIIYNIDGQKASHLYDLYFKEDSKLFGKDRKHQMSILYPLGILVEKNRQYLLRNAVEVLPDGAIVCHGDIPKNSIIHIMIGSKNASQQAAVEAAENVKKNLGGKAPKLILILESVSRLKLLGRRTTHELMQIRQVLGYRAPVIGMYTHGEIFPLQNEGSFKQPYHQNESIIIIAIA